MTGGAPQGRRTAIVTGPTGLIGGAGPSAGTGVVTADLATDAGIAIATDLIRTVPELGLLVCNAGVTGPRQHPAYIGVADWDAAQAVNVRPVVALATAAVRRWIGEGVHGATVAGRATGHAGGAS